MLWLHIVLGVTTSRDPLLQKAAESISRRAQGILEAFCFCLESRFSVKFVRNLLLRKRRGNYEHRISSSFVCLFVCLFNYLFIYLFIYL